jgi:hypothetical protein
VARDEVAAAIGGGWGSFTRGSLLRRVRPKTACDTLTRPVSRSQVTFVVLLQCAALLWVCHLIGDNGWDDGAITLAFARTFARHGRVALTPSSEVVEGFSSVSWFLLNSLIALGRPSFRTAIALSQALSVLSIAACTVLLARTCALLRIDRLFSALTVIGFAAWGCSFSEAGNGMEMGLLAAACLVMMNELLAPEPRLPFLCGGVVLAVTTRFEAVLYVGLFAVSVFSVPGRRAFRAIVLSGLFTVALLSVFRLAVFSDLLPNTFWAKRWPPYAAFSLGDRWAGGKELLRFFKLPLVAVGIALLSNLGLTKALRARRPALAILSAPILGAVVMGVLTGKHWGYPGRMPYFAFPPTMLLLSLVFSDGVAAAKSRPPVVRALASAALAAGSLLWAVWLSRAQFPFDWLAVARTGTFDVTPHSYAQSGQVFRRFTAAADLPHPILLTSDVGGLALCCDEFRIVDLAFLSNRKLAHDGPGALGAVLDAESPDLIEAHWEWPAVGKLYELPSFAARYAPAFAEGTRLWVRRDLGERIVRIGRGCWVPRERDDVRRALRSDRYARFELPADQKTFEAAGVILALDPAGDGVNLCARLN